MFILITLKSLGQAVNFFCILLAIVVQVSLGYRGFS